MDNDDDLNNVYSVETEDKEVDEFLKDTQMEKNKVFSTVCHVTKDWYESDAEIQGEMSIAKMTTALNKADLARLVTTRYF